MKKDNSAFKAYWKANGTTHIVALIITLAFCAYVGMKTTVFPLVVWLLIAVVFWAVRTHWLFGRWKKERDANKES